MLLFLYGMIQDYEIAMENKNEQADEITWGEIDMPSIKDRYPVVNQLSNRELDVFRGLLEDKKRKEIAEELCITENTVKKHISSIFAKLEVSTRKELLEKIR